jgi:hypothetical protein
MKFLINVSVFLLATLACSTPKAEKEDGGQFIPATSTPELSSEDTLAKYSYLLLQYSKGELYKWGTVFFIRINGRLLLGTNYHVFTNVRVQKQYEYKIRVSAAALSVVRNLPLLICIKYYRSLLRY